MTSPLATSFAIKALIGTAVLALAYEAQPYRPIVVTGTSMTPTYQDWQLIWADKRVPDVRRGDVVVVKSNEGVFLKRVAYVEGDYIFRKKAGSARFDLIQVQISPKAINHTIDSIQVPENHVYVVGDNLGESYDSREFGTVDQKDIIAWVPNAPAPSRFHRTVRPFTPHEVEPLLAALSQFTTP